MGIKKWFSSLWGDVSKNVGTAVTLAVLFAGYKASPGLWRWLNQGDGEVAYKAVFLLTVALVCSMSLLRFRFLQVRVTPVPGDGENASIAVRNLGRTGVFNTVIEILEVRRNGESEKVGNVFLIPAWRSMSHHGEIWIDRKGVQELLLGSITRDRHKPKYGLYGLTDGEVDGFALLDFRGRTIPYTYKGRIRSVEVDVELTVTIAEPRWVLSFLYPRRPYVGRFTVVGNDSSGLSVTATGRRLPSKNFGTSPGDPRGKGSTS